MKLTILGGGGFRVPLVFKALIADEAPGRVTELRLYDTDATRLEAIRAVLDELAEAAEQPPALISTTDLGEALEGTDFIFSAIRVGGTGGRALDEQIALSHGVIGQETVGAGGISYALRGIPAVLDIIQAVQQHAPEAYFINFTNPAGVITEVLQRHLGERVIGICDSPVGLARRIIDVLRGAGLVAADVPNISAGSERIKLKYAGLNHLGWLTALYVDGVSRGMPAVSAWRIRSSWHSLHAGVWMGLIAPWRSVSFSSGITSPQSTPITRPNPRQVSHAPMAELNENMDGIGAL